MRVKVTKRMANEIQKRTGFNATLEKLNCNNYQWYVSGDPDANIQDYDIETGLFSAIRIDYPAEYYACPRYLTTRDLSNIFYGCDGSINDFFRAVKNAIEI